VVLLAALAAPCAAQLLPLSSSSAAPAAPGSFMWRTLAWQDVAPATLSESPLRALQSARGATFAGEWAPLYRGRDGTRVEQLRQLARFAKTAGPLGLGVELTRESGTFRRGVSRWDVNSAGDVLQDGSVGLAWSRSAGAVALAGSFSRDERAGVAFEGEAFPAPGWRVALTASDIPQTGSLDMRWEDQAVAARGTWGERHAAVELAAPAGPGALRLAFESLDHVPRPSPYEPDDLASRLAWRTERSEYVIDLRRLRVAAEFAHGAGRQRVEVRRGGVAYAVAAGPLSENAVALRIGPAHARWWARGWAGASRASAAGSLALWVFDANAAATGARLAARSAIEIRHAGVSLDGARAQNRGWDGGVAAWALDPEGDYEMWRGLVFGLGRAGDRWRPLEPGRLLLAGVRIARSQPVFGRTLRIEVVQWAPLARQPSRSVAPGAAWVAPSASPAVQAGPPVSPQASPFPQPVPQGRDWGGTIVRVSI
jgi:hypothetical protein